ncbi:MAG TPA: single-stranded DNA-binding protein [Ktedonobacterales bacterium]|nr:single-stranded DNA-binding protein [Ktedonobacterales bacterium]
MVNRIFLIGNLGREPEMSYTPSGKAVTKFTMAVNRVQRNRESGEMQKETDWFSIVAWDRLAETCNTYLHKGSKVFIEGRIQSRKYTDKNGVERTVWDVIASDMQMLDPKEGGAGRAAGGAEGGYGDAGDQSPEDIPF